MKAPAQQKAFRAISSLGLLSTMLMLSRDLRAERSCCILLPEVRFQNNSTTPVEGFLDLRCVSRRMHADCALSDVARLLRENPTITMLLVGHTDSEEVCAETLSLPRAQRMACELVSTFGIEAGRLTTEGKGSSQPRIVERMLRQMTKQERGQGRQINRRVEFRVMSFDWIPPHLDGIAAVRFLSDPETPSASSNSFCDEPVEAPDSSALVQALDTPIIPIEEPVAVSLESGSAQLEAVAPMIVPNPIVNDELNLHWLTERAQGLSIRMMTLDGRLIAEHRTAEAPQGALLQLPVPTELASGAYILKLTEGVRTWSLRFIK